ESPKVGIGVLVEAHVLAEALGIERPPFHVRVVAGLLAKGGKSGQSLGDRNLHVMAGDAFVIGSGLAGDQRTVLVVASVDHHSSAARAIGGAGYVFGGGRVVPAEFFDGLDIELGGWEQAEELGKLGRHVGDVAPVGLENLLAGSGAQLG